MGYSRITLATLFALGLLGTGSAQAAPASVHVELNGPQKTTATATPTQPSVNQVMAHPGSYGPVRVTDTLWSLANKYRPSSSVSVYQTMVAIYKKNPQSFAEGNINHMRVGSQMLLPSVAEASVIADAQARTKFHSDNARWKGLPPTAAASNASLTSKPAANSPVAAKVKAAPVVASAQAVAAHPHHTSKPAVSSPVIAKAKTAPTVTPAPKPAAKPVSKPTAKPTAKPTSTRPLASKGAPIPTLLTASAPQPKPLGKVVKVSKPESANSKRPSTQDKPARKANSELTLALQDARTQLGKMTELNSQLKGNVQSLTAEVETLKAQLQDQTLLRKEITDLKALPAPVVVPAVAPKSDGLIALLSSPANFALILALPLLLIVGLIALWLQARASARRMQAQSRTRGNPRRESEPAKKAPTLGESGQSNAKKEPTFSEPAQGSANAKKEPTLNEPAQGSANAKKEPTLNEGSAMGSKGAASAPQSAPAAQSAFAQSTKGSIQANGSNKSNKSK
ncbi:MAG: FimV/HubP family polar landmark protein [Aeromonas sp.]